MITKNRTLMMIFVFSMLVPLTNLFAESPREFPKDFDRKEAEVLFNSMSMQSGIASPKSLAALAKEHSKIGESATSLGFAAKSDESKFFIIGALFSESIAYLKGDQKDLAVKRLEAIEKEFINLNVPNSLYNYISKTRNIVEYKDYNTEILSNFLSLFQPFFEDYARGKGADNLILFRAGSWLVDMSLAAAADNRLLLKQEDKLNYFIEEMERMDAPKGVIKALNKIKEIAGQEEISEKDVNQVIKQIEKIQTILA